VVYQDVDAMERKPNVRPGATTFDGATYDKRNTTIVEREITNMWKHPTVQDLEAASTWASDSDDESKEYYKNK